MAPPGSDVGIYVDLMAPVEIGDVIQTTSGRRYVVAHVRRQRRGRHVGRQHLRAVVMAPGDPLPTKGTLHRIVWYRRGAGD